ncbi:hypothetical protein [Pseudomonas sp.]|uniref:hypothetical protein n=1 Tax=Pseudomonas sp. TaxID=306 RepID=UPI003D0B89D3
MKPADLVQDLYAQAARDLCASGDPRLEELKWQIAKSELPGSPIKPESLADLFHETPEWGVAAFADLRAGGFIQHQLTYFTWAHLDVRTNAYDFDVLAAIEAIVAMQCRYLDLTPILPALERLAATIQEYAEREELLKVCLITQHLLLVLVAAVNSPELFREYTAIAKASRAYAWSTLLGDGAAARISATINGMVEALASRDAVTAARAATYLRGLPSIPGLSAIPASY